MDDILITAVDAQIKDASQSHLISSMLNGVQNLFNLALNEFTLQEMQNIGVVRIIMKTEKAEAPNGVDNLLCFDRLRSHCQRTKEEYNL